jgi:DNA-binding transcriptional MerR regulator
VIYFDLDARRQSVDAHVAQALPNTSRRTLLRSTEVCELLKVQPYVLRSWEKEFPKLGVVKEPDGPRYYRRSDIDQVLRIKQLVYGEGLTIAGARRKLDDERAAASTTALPFEDEDDDGQAPGLSAATRVQLDGIRRGLKSLLEMLGPARGGEPGKPNGKPVAEAAAGAAPKLRTPARPARAVAQPGRSKAKSKDGRRTGRSARG